ncbi:peptidase M23-like protein [Herbihabitans rhizosphaerae]|uniref:Peptidase M23-like protein n=1 Tax=Herbihabitans rhizosphaerae TaxID=1872711 RepID=A0A4Q7KE10_9PSEU|nr:M23 family metallopeptidase [Herbihabitans rhizosphaerae]RZS32291.1 peptidase M23-like protein [Herbihabitans rhizosphaerae]
MRVKPLLSAAVCVLLSGATLLFSPAVASAAPAFQLPFPCGQTWNGDSDNSSAHRSHEIDFNRGSTPDADLGDTVVAAAEGTVRTAAHQGSANGYGNLVKIEHAGNYFTYYAHLNTMAVTAGQVVSRGQAIGTLGNTSKPGNNISPHLHYEVRLGSSGYPGNIQRATFDGRTFGYPNANVKSNNCASPYDPAELCGSGYKVIDTARLGSAGTVNLMWNGGAKNNCVVTLKFASVGTPTATAAYLEPEGVTRKTNSGQFTHYAGPVAMNSPSCVKWGGSAGGVSYNSPLEHC